MSQDQTYFTLSILGLDSSLEDLVSGLCFDYGALGVSQQLSFEQAGDHYEPITKVEERIQLSVYFQAKPSEDFVLRLSEIAPGSQIAVNEDEVKDWMEEWKKGFEEFELVNEIWVVPSWRTAPKSAKKVIQMDPGMAFGTGTHETTKIASRLIYDLVGQKDLRTMLDVGTGTGLLAILAEHLGLTMIECTEIDKMARDVARENLVLNQSKAIKVHDKQVKDLLNSFDLVVANIIDGVLIDIQKHLLRCMTRGGYLIVTGILEEREAQFQHRFHLPEGYSWVERQQQGEWVGLLGAQR
ncbi:MAG: 50S ribosomal protein L11 methyltransferase [Pseudomonadota bacterium]